MNGTTSDKVAAVDAVNFIVIITPALKNTVPPPPLLIEIEFKFIVKV
jgi:hypothetical protein